MKPDQFLDQLQDTAAAQNLSGFQRGNVGLFWKSSIKAPEMDNPAADGLIRWQRCLEERSKVIRPLGMNAKMSTVHGLVGVSARDQDAPFSLLL